MSTSTTFNKPVKNIRSGAVQAAIWKNEAASGAFLSVTFSRAYKKGDEWMSTNSFGARDLLDLRRVLTSAEQFIAEEPV